MSELTKASPKEKATGLKHKPETASQRPLTFAATRYGAVDSTAVETTPRRDDLLRRGPALFRRETKPVLPPDASTDHAPTFSESGLFQDLSGVPPHATEAGASPTQRQIGVGVSTAQHARPAESAGQTGRLTPWVVGAEAGGSVGFDLSGLAAHADSHGARVGPVEAAAGRLGIPPTIQRTNETASDPELDLLVILGPEPTERSVAYERESLLYLYKYLKRIRKSTPELEPAVKSVLNRYFPGAGEQVWEASKNPLAGYMGSRYISGARMERARELGLTETERGGWKKKFMGSDVLFFSGHHFGAPGFGDPGAFESLDIKRLRTGRRPAVFERVKLIMVSSCSVLRRSALPTFRTRFPNAYILGWYWSAPYYQSNMMAKFLDKLPQDLILEDPKDMAKVLQLWETFAENLEKENVRLLTSSRRRAGKKGLGYATPRGTVKYLVRDRRRNWVWKTESR